MHKACASKSLTSLAARPATPRTVLRWSFNAIQAARPFWAGRCFVVMSFAPKLESAFSEGIRSAIELDCGLTVVRMDGVEHNEKICDRIIVEIRKAQFVVADFTLHRAGVYFEAGFAAALGRTVIWACRKDELAKTHFDTRQYNHIDWETPAELRRRLTERRQATVVMGCAW